MPTDPLGPPRRQPAGRRPAPCRWALCGSLDLRLAAGRSSRSARRSCIRPQARIIDPRTLATSWPPTRCRAAPTRPGTGEFQNFTGGGYFFLDRQDRIVGPDQDRATSRALARAPMAAALRQGRRLRPDLGAAPPSERDHLRSARLPRARSGSSPSRTAWSACSNPRTRRIRSLRLGEEIENSFAVGAQRRLHRLRQAHVPLQGRTRAGPPWSLVGRLSQLRHRQAQPGRRRLGHHADGHARRLRRHHRQRRPDGRRRLPDERQAAQAARRASVCTVPVFDAGRQRDGEHADRRAAAR